MSVNRKHLYLYKILARGKAPGGNVFKRKTGPAGRAALSVREAPSWRQVVRRSLASQGSFLFLLRSERKSGLCYFLDQKKVTKD